MKRKVAKTVRLRLSPNEEAELIRAELERRRKLRLQQVREQERCIALQIRKEVQQRRDRELDKLAEELKAEWQRQQRDKLQSLEKLYQDSLLAVGEGHRSAKENEPDWEAMARKAEEDHERAEERHREALKELKSRRQKQLDERTRHIQARRKAMLAEKERAARVASLPPRPPEPFETIETKKPPSVKMSDVDCFSVTRYHLPETAVDSEVGTEQRDAWRAAEEEGQRLEELGQEGERERREQLEKARLRGEHALRKEHLAQDRERFLQQLERLQQADLQRRRQLVANMPVQIFHPPYQRQEMAEERQRDLEIAFEDLYSGERRVKGDLVLQLVPEPLPTLSTGSQDLDVTLESTAEEATEMRDECQTAEAPARERAQSEGEARRGLLKKLLDRVRVQRAQQSLQDGSETAGDSTTIETGSLASGERELLAPTSQEKPTEPEPLSPAQAHEVTEDSVVAGTVLRHQGAAVEMSQTEAEKKRRDEDLERQKREQLEVLEQLEEQRRSLEQHLQVACLGMAEGGAPYLPAQQQRDNLPAPDHPADVGQMNQDAQASAVKDEHSRRIRQYQQRLLEQNRLHKQSVEHARRRLEEYQSLLKMKYPATASQPTAGLYPKGPPSVPAMLPTDSTLAPGFPREPQAQRSAASLNFAAPGLQAGDSSTWVDHALNVPTQDCPCDSGTPLLSLAREELLQHGQQSTGPCQVSVEGRQSGTDPQPCRSALCRAPRLVPERPGSSESQQGRSSTTTHPAPPIRPPALDLQVAGQRFGIQGPQQQMGLLDSGANPEAENMLRDSSLGQQRAPLQGDEQAALQQEAHEKDDVENNDGLLCGAQGSPGWPAESGLDQAERLHLMSVLLEALQRETHSQLPQSASSSVSDRPSPTTSVTFQPSDTHSSSERDFRNVLHPKAPKPPLARTKLGILEMIEQHELSAIPEVETPVNASLATMGEDSPEASSVVTEDQRERVDSCCTGNSTVSQGSGGSCLTLTGTGSIGSSQMSWRERLCMETGLYPQPDSSAACTPADVRHSPDPQRGGPANGDVKVSAEDQPVSHLHAVDVCSPSPTRDHTEAEGLSTTVSTGSFSTNDPDHSSVCTGETPRCVPANVYLSGCTPPTCEPHPQRSSVQQIIDKYTKELNDSLGMAGNITVLSSERNDSSLGEEFYPMVPVAGSSGQQSTSWSQVLGAGSMGLCSDHTLRTDLDTTGQMLGNGSDSYIQDKHGDDFFPLEPKPDLDSSSSSSSQRLGGLERISRAEKWDLAVRRIIERLADQSPSQCLAEETGTRLSAMIGQLLNQSCHWQDSDGRASAGQHGDVTGGCIIRLLEDEDLDCEPLPSPVYMGGALCRPRHCKGSETSTPARPPLVQVSGRCSESLMEQPHCETMQLISQDHPLSPMEHQRTRNTVSDSFHPLLAKTGASKTAGFCTSACNAMESQASEASPEHLRAEPPESSRHLMASSHGSLIQLLSPQCEMLGSLLMEDSLPCGPPHDGACSDSGSGDHYAISACTPSDLVSKDPQGSWASGSQVTSPMWERMLDTNTGRGILEEPELTLVSLTEMTLQEEEEEELTSARAETKSDTQGQCDGQTSVVFTSGETIKNCKAASPDGDDRSSENESAASYAVMLVEFEATAGSLQQVLLQKRQDFVQRSAQRQEELKARRHRRTSLHVSWPASRPKVKSRQEPPAISELKKVGEVSVCTPDQRVSVCTPDQRKLEEAEMYRRTERLYSQLEEVKQRREMRTRQELCARNRERAKEFQKKTLQKLRARHAVP